MASANLKKPCAKCNKGAGVATCDGCQQSFCVKHFVEHRQELAHHMEDIGQEHDLLRRDFDQYSTDDNLLSRINIWEQDSIAKIQVAAEVARTDLHELLDKNKKELTTLLTKITSELQVCRESDDYTEMDINKWTEQLKELRKMLESPSSISIDEKESSKLVIRLIEVRDQHQHRSSAPSSVCIDEKESSKSVIRLTDILSRDQHQHSSSAPSSVCIDQKESSKSAIRLTDILSRDQHQHRSSAPSSVCIDQKESSKSAIRLADILSRDQHQHRSSAPSSVCIDEKESSKSVIRLTEILSRDQHRSSTPTSGSLQPRISGVIESGSASNERFDEILGKATVSEDNLVATCHADGLFSSPIMYGVNRYSRGTHRINFRIDKVSKTRMFLGITASSGKLDGHFRDKSQYGWWGLSTAVVSGERRDVSINDIVKRGDEVTLTLNCNDRHIQLQHHRSNQSRELLVDTNDCPFPWKIVVKLESEGDSVRILP